MHYTTIEQLDMTSISENSLDHKQKKHNQISSIPIKVSEDFFIIEQERCIHWWQYSHYKMFKFQNLADKNLLYESTIQVFLFFSFLFEDKHSPRSMNKKHSTRLMKFLYPNFCTSTMKFIHQEDPLLTSTSAHTQDTTQQREGKRESSSFNYISI